MNKQISMRILSATVVAIMLLALCAGCKDEPEIVAQEESTPDNYAYDSSEYTYVAQAVKFPASINVAPFTFAYHDGKVYFCGYNTENIDEDNPYLTVSTARIYSMNIDGSEVTELTGYSLPVEALGDTDDIGFNFGIECMSFDSDGNLWVAEYWNAYTCDLPEDFDGGYHDAYEYMETLNSGNLVRKLDSTGAELRSKDISDRRKLPGWEFLRITSIFVDSDAAGGEVVYLCSSSYQSGSSLGYLISDGVLT